MAITWVLVTVSNNKPMFHTVLGLLLFTIAVTAQASAQSAQPVWVKQFLQRWEADPTPRYVWLLPPLKQEVATILDHPYPKVRLPWWKSGARTLWVLEEIGKDLPITVGIVIEKERIISVEILKFRESRGGEVQLPAFRRQFQGAHLIEDKRLSHDIDGISGATLSVRAVTKLARMALLLDAHIRNTTP